RNAIADRGNKGDVRRIGIDHASGRGPCALVLRVHEGGIERPGPALAPDGGTAGFLRAQRQRAIGGGIQVADLARHLEEIALRRKHQGSRCRQRQVLNDPEHASYSIAASARDLAMLTAQAPATARWSISPSSLPSRRRPPGLPLLPRTDRSSASR